MIDGSNRTKEDIGLYTEILHASCDWKTIAVRGVRCNGENIYLKGDRGFNSNHNKRKKQRFHFQIFKFAQQYNWRDQRKSFRKTKICINIKNIEKKY